MRPQPSHITRRVRSLPTTKFLQSATDAAGSDCHLEFLGGAEGYLFAGFNLDWLAGCWIAAYAGGTMAHLQNSESGDLYLLALLQVLGDHADKVIHHLQALLLGELMLVCQRMR